MKTLLVAANTYRLGVRSLSFLALTLILPLILVAAGALPWIVQAARGAAPDALGYVDLTVTLPPLDGSAGDLPLAAYRSTAAAEESLARGEIDGFLLIPEGYLRGEPTRYVGSRPPTRATLDALQRTLRGALAQGADPAAAARLAAPARVTYESVDGEVLGEETWLVVRALFPGILALVYCLAVFTGTGQMGSAVIREKEHRAMEMVLTSLHPASLVGGKVLGMALLSLTQLGTWAVGGLAAAGLFVTGRLGVPGFSPPGDAVLWGALLCVPGYLLYAVLAAGLGIIAGDEQNAQELAGGLGLVALGPLWLLGIVFLAPEGPFAVALSLFPLSAPTVLLVRMAISDVPPWQMATALSLLLASLFVAIWAVARVFRAAMLLYGQRLRPGQVLRALLADGE